MSIFHNRGGLFMERALNVMTEEEEEQEKYDEYGQPIDAFGQPIGE